MSTLEDIEEIRISDNHYRSVVAHGLRKLEGDYRPDETPERKAYGLLGGRPQGAQVDTTHVFCLARNARYEPAYRQQMDELMTSLAVPSETPLERRGWLTDPDELLAAERQCDAEHAVIFASYHMHRVAWPDDPLRDSCTAIDTALASGGGLWVFILSLVDPANPTLRAYFEGDNDREARIVRGGG
jgi:hypothetical protein